MAATLLGLYLVVLAARLALRELNLRHLRRRGHQVPAGFEGVVDGEQLARAARYTAARARLGLVESLFDAALVLTFLFGGLVEVYARAVRDLSSSFVGGGVIFFLGLTIAQRALDIPFELSSTFGIERRFAFSTTTPRLWISDFVKGLLLSMAITALAVAAGLALVQALPGLWWLAVWGFLAGLVVLLLYLAPTLIEPLFNRYTPVADPALVAAIEAVASRAGVAVSRILQVDASKRSRHSNAYFTGVGRVKRVILYDTLLEQMSQGEIVAVLAHELGHWRRRHLAQRLAVTLAGGLAASLLAWLLVGWGGLPGLVGLAQADFCTRLLILGFLGSLALDLLTPLATAWSRHHERQADRFAVELTGTPAALAAALVKLARENLANLHPHPIFAALYYSHPPLVQRVHDLRARSAGGGEGSRDQPATSGGV